MAEGRSRLIEGIRITGSLGAIALFGLLATGCSLGGKKDEAAGPAKIRIWRVGQDKDSIEDAISDFESANPGAAEVTYARKEADGYELAALKSLAARTGPDIWSIPNDWLGDHAVRISPLPDDFFYDAETKENESAVAAVSALYPAGIAEQLLSTDGKSVIGAPTTVDSLHLYYNPDLFEAAYQDFEASQGDDPSDDVLTPVQQLLSAPPATWSTLVDQTKYLTKRSGTAISRSAIAIGTADNVPDSDSILQLLMLQNGTKIISSDRARALFHIPQSAPAGGTVRPGENALSFYTSFSDPSKPTYTWNPSMPQALDAFAQGKVAMVIAFSDFGKKLNVEYPSFSFETAAAPQISVGTNQTPVNFIRFSVETITKTADNYNAAVALLKRYVSPTSVGSMASATGLSSPFLSQLQDADEFQISQVLTGQAVYKKKRAQFDGAFRQMIIDSTQNGIANDKALDTAAQTINGLLASSEE